MSLNVCEDAEGEKAAVSVYIGTNLYNISQNVLKPPSTGQILINVYKNINSQLLLESQLLPKMISVFSCCKNVLNIQ